MAVSIAQVIVAKARQRPVDAMQWLILGLVIVLALGLINIVIASAFEFRVWVWFISVVAIGAKIVAFLIQYALMRTLVRRKLRAQPVV